MSDATLANNNTVHFEGSEQVYPCWCGETHRGQYGLYDFGHHNCFHDEPLLQDEYGLICPLCGLTFTTQTIQPQGVSGE